MRVTKLCQFKQYSYIKCCGDTINIYIYICIYVHIYILWYNTQIPKHIRRITKSNNPPNYLKTKKKHYLLKIQWYTYIYIYGSWAVLYKSSFVHLKYFLPNKSGNKHSTKRSAISRVPYWIKNMFLLCVVDRCKMLERKEYASMSTRIHSTYG